MIAFIKAQEQQFLKQTYKRALITCLTLLLVFSSYAYSQQEDQEKKYVWLWDIIHACDKKKDIWNTPCKQTLSELFMSDNYQPETANDFKDLKPGETVFIPSFTLPNFICEVVPKINVPFILVTTWYDSGIKYLWMPAKSPAWPSWVEVNNQLIKNFVNNPKLIHWFAANYDLPEKYDKITLIPLGLDFHETLRFHDYDGSVDEQKTFKEIVSKAKPTYQRLPLVHANFHFRDNIAMFNQPLAQRCGYTRKSLADELRNAPFMYLQPEFMHRTSMLNQKMQYAFSMSPHGNGLDCHRTWEDLTIGCIVIVKTSPLDPLYAGLPVVIVNEWSDITEEKLADWLAQYGDAFTNPAYQEKLTSTYWINKIKTMQQEWRKQKEK